ncbi:MAG: hypothetical protein ABIH70_01960 [Chloroflexota bacterium]
MEKQKYVVMLEVSPEFSQQFPKVEAEGMADMIRDAVRAKSCSFMGAVPFKVNVQWAGEVSSAYGETREYKFGELDGADESATSITYCIEGSKVDGR